MAVTEAYSRSAVSVTQANNYSITNNSTTLAAQTTAGAYQLFVRAGAMVKGDEAIIKIYEKTISGGTQDVIFDATLSDVQSQPFVSPVLMLLNGWDMTIQMVTATSRNFDASIRKA